MHYKSPFPVLIYSGVDLQGINDQTLAKAKKILLVELDHADNGALSIDGDIFTKNDILLLFESLSNTEHLVYHRWIHENPGLQALLENKELEDYDELFDEQLLKDEKTTGFRSFISPYLTQPLGKVLSQTFTRQEYIKGLKVMQAIPLIEHADYDNTFGKLQSNIRGITKELKMFNERGVEQFKEHQCHYINYYFIQFLNQLPDAFGMLRENFAIELINLSVTIQHKHAYLCKRLYFSLSVLDCSEETKKVIKSNLEIFKRASVDQPSSGNKTPEPQSSGAILLKIGFMVIFFFVAILKNCDNSSSTRNYKMDYAKPLLHKITHYGNLSDLKNLTKSQLEYGNQTTLTDSIIDLSADTTALPYSSEYKNLMEYKIGRRIWVTNESGYDAVLFLSTKWHNYSAFLLTGQKLSFYVANNDYLQFYLGKRWVHKQQKQLSTVKRDHFSEVDSTTLTYLQNIWQSQCNTSSTCSDSSFSLYVDENNDVQFSANSNTSGFRKVDEYFFVKTL